jgi:hypothetical protein
MRVGLHKSRLGTARRCLPTGRQSQVFPRVFDSLALALQAMLDYHPSRAGCDPTNPASSTGKGQVFE